MPIAVTAQPTVINLAWHKSKQLHIYVIQGAGIAQWLKRKTRDRKFVIVQELCESRGGRPGLSVLTSLLASVDVKLY